MKAMQHNQFMTLLKNRLQAISWEPWLLIAVGTLMANISWLKWPDLVIDFGEQAYIAWRLSEGTVLYRDIAYFYGPLSSYIHALLFKVFGPQLMVLIIFNLSLVATLTVVIYRLFLLVGSRLSATIAGLAFLVVFAFSQYLWMGNHNFICSYVYDVTHGIFLSFLAAGQFAAFTKSRQKSKLILLGLLSGLVLLTKIEVSLAWTTAVLIGLFLLFKTWNCSFYQCRNYMALFCFGLFFPFMMFTVYFAYHMGWSQGLQAMLGPWTYVFSTSIGSLAFYKGVMGTDALGENLITIFSYLIMWVLFLAALAALNHVVRKPFKPSTLYIVLALILFLVTRNSYHLFIPWLELLRPLPFIMLGTAIVLCIRLWKGNKDLESPVPNVVLAVLTIFATVLLLKIFFKTHVYHYGTALAMPATLILFKLLIDDLSDKLKSSSGEHALFKGPLVAGIILFIFVHFTISAGYYGKKVFPVASGGDSVISYHPEVAPRALFFQITLDVLNQEMKEGETLAAFPTGTLLNYLTRKENPIDSISFNPGTWKLLGEQRILTDLQTTPPTYVAIVYHDFLEFGTRFFGRDFGKDIYQWVLKDYDSIKLIGKDPVKGEGFGIHLYKLRAATPD